MGGIRRYWREAIPVVFPAVDSKADVRYHQETGTVLIAKFGFLRAAYQLEWCEESVRNQVQNQVEE